MPLTIHDGSIDPYREIQSYILDNFSSELSVDPDYLYRWIKLTEKDILFNFNYKPRFLNSKLTYFRAQKGPSASIAKKVIFNWEPYVKEISEYEVLGDHVSLISSPNIESLSEKIWSCLKEAHNN